jgi:hypothetical protein
MITALIKTSEIMNSLATTYNTVEEQCYNIKSTLIYVHKQEELYIIALDYRRVQYNMFIAQKTQHIGTISGAENIAKMMDYLLCYDDIEVPKDLKFNFSIKRNGKLDIFEENFWGEFKKNFPKT